MEQSFDKIAVFTDIHFGNKSNSDQFNLDALNFLDWFMKEADEFGAKTCYFLGDWHHNRSTINVNTLNYSIEGMTRLANHFDKFYFIAGNHDLFFKDKRDVTSARFADLMDKVTVVQHPLSFGDVRLQPWMVGEEWMDVPTWEERYVFGHFEIPGFMMSGFECPDNGTINRKHFKNQEYVFTGHFHKRQKAGNIHYIGNAFSHDFADAWDFDKGAMFLEYGQKPIYKNWKDGPRYITISLTKLLEEPERYLTPMTYAQISVDSKLSYEEIVTIRDELEKNYKVREMDLIIRNPLDDIESQTAELDFHSIDQIILDGLQQVESTVIDNDMLIQIYKSI